MLEEGRKGECGLGGISEHRRQRGAHAETQVNLRFEPVNMHRSVFGPVFSCSYPFDLPHPSTACRSPQTPSPQSSYSETRKRALISQFQLTPCSPTPSLCVCPASLPPPSQHHSVLKRARRPGHKDERTLRPPAGRHQPRLQRIQHRGPFFLILPSPSILSPPSEGSNRLRAWSES